MKYEVFTRRVNWYEMRLDGNWLVYDPQLKYWFAIASHSNTEVQGVGRTATRAYWMLCEKMNRFGETAKPLDNFQILDKLSYTKTEKVYNY